MYSKKTKKTLKSNWITLNVLVKYIILFGTYEPLSEWFLSFKVSCDK